MSQIHLAGIVPLANFKTDIELPYPAGLLPVQNKWTLVQQAVLECAMAGCNTIWVVANDDLAPAVKHQVGEWIYDPVYLYRTKNPAYYEDNRKEIPIYYVPIHPKDRQKRDSYGWSVLYGIHSAWKISWSISKWLEPQKYYISFPYGVFDHNEIREHRLAIKNVNQNVILKHNNQSVQDGLHTSFTMTPEDFKVCRRWINKITTREYLPPKPNEKYPTQRLPLHQRWSARHFGFDEVFHELSVDNSVIIEPSWFYDVSTWEGYEQFIASGKKPEYLSYLLTQSRRQAKMGVMEGL